MVRKSVRVVVADQSAVMYLLSMIFPIVHVACAGCEDDTIDTQRRANDDCQPKPNRWPLKPTERARLNRWGTCALVLHDPAIVIAARKRTNRFLVAETGSRPHSLRHAWRGV